MLPRTLSLQETSILLYEIYLLQIPSANLNQPHESQYIVNVNNIAPGIRFVCCPVQLAIGDSLLRNRNIVNIREKQFLVCAIELIFHKELDPSKPRFASQMLASAARVCDSHFILDMG